MKALITGASSGIGRDIARVLANKGYELIIVARRKELLEQLKSDLRTKVIVEVCDISKKENCINLFEKYKDIDILINNAGFGTFGNFNETDLNTELNLIDTNIMAVHILSKLYVTEMEKRNYGHILNVSSIAGFMPSGPLMATYYASKSYVISLSRSINKELKKKNSNIKISILCPGPVNTNFNNVAGVKFGMKPLSSEYVAKYAIEKMLKNKEVIIPGLINKFAVYGSKFGPCKLTEEIVYRNQMRKNS